MRLAWLVLVLGCGRGGEPAPCERHAEPCAASAGSAGQASGTERLDERKRRAWRSNVIDRAPGATTCAKFTGQALVATWDDCTDHVRRELTCARDHRDEIQCLCVENAVEKWRFTARDPRLDDQAEATRVARSNCHSSFEGF